MTSGVVAASIVAHVPTLGLAQNTPPFQLPLVEGERQLGAELRAGKPDLFVMLSSHWVCTFEWYATGRQVFEGVCVAEEAPHLIPGIPYRRKGDPEFARALVEEWGKVSVPGRVNDFEHSTYDYGSLVPLLYLDPDAEVPVVHLPSVLMADHAECMRAGRAIDTVARRQGKKVVFFASSALSHYLVRGRENRPTPDREAMDMRFMDMMKRGAIDEALAWFPEFSKLGAVEMGGRPVATFLGVVQAMRDAGAKLTAKQYGGYAQSSGSGNVVLNMAA